MYLDADDLKKALKKETDRCLSELEDLFKLGKPEIHALEESSAYKMAFYEKRGYLQGKLDAYENIQYAIEIHLSQFKDAKKK